jgi:peptidoglycan-associated lipoprotein
MKTIITTFLSVLMCLGLMACSSGSHAHKHEAQVEQARQVGAQPNDTHVITRGETPQAALQEDNNPAAAALANQRQQAGIVIHFDFDSTHLSSKDQQQLQTLADYLATHGRAKMRIEGNTDERGSREYNIALGERRAQGVADALGQMGVSKKQLSLISYGEEKPVDMGHDDAAYRKNRRAELHVIG